MSLNFANSVKGLILNLKNKIDLSTERSTAIATGFLAVDDYIPEAEEQEPSVDGLRYVNVSPDDVDIVWEQLNSLNDIPDPLTGSLLTSDLFITTENLVDKVRCNSTTDSITLNINDAPVVKFDKSEGTLGLATTYSSNGVTGKLENIPQDLSDSIDLNIVISSALEVASNMKTKTMLSYVDLTNAFTYYKNKVENKITNLKGAALTYYQIICDNLKTGPLGILTTIKNLYKSSQNVQATASGFEFTDNSQYGVITNLWGAIKSILSTVADVVFELLAWIGNVLGAIVYSLYTLAKGLIGLFNTALDSATYATIKDNEPDFYCFQHAIFQGQYAASSYLGMQLLSYFPEAEQWGSCLLQTPWGPTIIYVDIDNDTICVESHPSAALKYGDFDTLEGPLITETPHSTSANAYDYTWWYTPGTSGETDSSFRYLWNCISGNITGSHEGVGWVGIVPDNLSESDIDNYLRESCLMAMNIFLICIGMECAKNRSDHKFIIESDGTCLSATSVQKAYLANIVCIMQETRHPGSHADPSGLKWEDILNEGGMNSKLVGIDGHFPFSVNGNVGLLNIAQLFKDLRESFEALCADANESLDYVQPFSSLGEAYVKTPAISRTYAIAALVATTVGIAAASAVIAISAIKVTKRRNVKRAKLKADAERLWDVQKNNPSAENYAAYRKAARRNNRFVKRFGGSALSKNGYWDAVESNTTQTATDSNEILSDIWGSPALASIADKLETKDPTGIVSTLKQVTKSQDDIGVVYKAITGVDAE